jgi:hypothetical protein
MVTTAFCDQPLTARSISPRQWSIAY